MKTAMRYLPNKKITAAIVALLMLAAQPAAAGVLSSFEADYTVTRGNLTLGDGQFSLKPWSGNPNCYVYHGKAVPRALLRFLVGDITDDSYFCSEGKDIRVQRFRHIEDSDADDSHTLVFDWENSEVTYTGQKAEGGKSRYALPDGAVDLHSLHIAARLWLENMQDSTQPAEREFAIADENEIKRYTLATSPGGLIKTPIGEFDTVKIARVDDPKKQFTLWAAPALDFLPVKVESKKRDDPIVRLSIQGYRGGASAPSGQTSGDN